MLRSCNQGGGMKKLNHITAGLLLAVLVCLGVTARSYAQSASSATILGNVIDPAGRTVPNVKVVARNVDTGLERETLTTSEGLYVIPNLPPGTYNVRVEASGFAKAEAKGVTIQIGDQRGVNFKLALASVTTEITVSATTPLVETTKTDSSTVINENDMKGLPVLNSPSSTFDDYAGLAVGTPGVRFDVSANSFDLIGPGAYNNRGNLVNVDGGNITDQVVSTRDTLGATLDEVKEFQIITNNYNAEYGEAGSIIINVVTKSGTNSIHGSAHASFRGRNFAASNFFYNEFDPHAAFRRAPFQKQEWGVQSGGPFVKDKTFWFLNFDKVQQAVPLTLINQPPSGTQAVTVSQPTHEILWTAKVDHKLFPNHQLLLRFNEDRSLTDNLLVQIPQFAQPSSLTAFLVHDNTLNAGLVSSVGPHVVNEARFFWHRFLTQLPTKSSLPGVRTSSTYTGAAFCCPQGGLQHRYQYLDNVTWTHGTHTIKGGVNISHFPYFSLFQQFHFGEWDLRNSTFTFAAGPGAVDSSDTISGLYVQDSWKIRPSLTLNYGVRWDYEDGAFKGGTIHGPSGGCFQANGIIPACSSDINNWQPRVGLAWSPRFESGFLHAIFGGPDRSVIRASFAEITQLAYLNVSLDSLNFDGVTLLTGQAGFLCTSLTPGCTDPVGRFFPGTPPASALPSTSPSGPFGRVRPIAPNLHNPETRHLSLSISRELGGNLVVNAGYTGVLGFGQFGENDQNYPTINPDPAHAGFFFLGPRPDSRFLAIRQNQNSRTSAYHGGYFQVQKRFSHHFQAQGSYTYAKVLASTEDFYGTSEPGDPRNIRAERAPAQNDIRHLGNFTFVIDTNNLISQRFLKPVVNGWSFGMLAQLHSGNPYPVSTGEGPFSGSVFPGVGAETQQRPNVLSNGTLIATNVASNTGFNLQVGQTGAAMCACPQTTFNAPAGASSLGPVDSFSGNIVDFQFLNGNLQRNAGISDPFYRFDFGVGKTFRVGERIELEFRADIINLFNHTNFTLFNGNNILDNFSIGAPGCTSCIDQNTGFYIGASGQVLHIQDLQHGRASKDLKNLQFLGLGDPTAADTPRTIQFKFRVAW